MMKCIKLMFFYFYFLFFPVSLKLFSVDVDVVCNCCQRCVPKIHSLCRSSSGRVQFTHWEVKGKWTPVSETRGKNEEEEGKKEAHHIIILSWRPTKISGFKTCFSEIFFCLFCFSGGKKTKQCVPLEWCCFFLCFLLKTPVWSPHCTKSLCHYLCYLILACLGMPCS